MLLNTLRRSDPGVSTGVGCTGSEMGHMFYNNMVAEGFGGILSGTNRANLALFTNLQSATYWSDTVHVPSPVQAWFFSTRVGFQGQSLQSIGFYAWAVRPGDVAAAIPEPETYALLLAGLGLLAVVEKRRRRTFGAS